MALKWQSSAAFHAAAAVQADRAASELQQWSLGIELGEYRFESSQACTDRQRAHSQRTHTPLESTCYSARISTRFFIRDEEMSPLLGIVPPTDIDGGEPPTILREISYIQGLFLF